MTTPAIAFDSVSRRFKKTQALSHFSLAVEPGSIVGLLGRNGAGKTTALRLAIGDLYPDEGQIRSFGMDPATKPLAVRERSSLLAEESVLYPWMTVGEILHFAAATHPRWDTKLAAHLEQRLNLESEKRIAALSRGTRAKVGLLLAVACRPDLLLLDDPTAGLDPLVRREFLEGVLATIHSEGGAVIYASHLIHDIERICDRVVILDGGHKVLEAEVEELKSRIRRATAVFPGPPPALDELPGKLRMSQDGRVLRLVVEGDETKVASALRKGGAESLHFDALSLEDILVAYLGDDSKNTKPTSETPQEETPRV